MAVIDVTCDPAGAGSGFDYADMQSALDDRPSNMVTAAEQWNILCSGAFTGGDVSMAGHTTNSSYYCRITTAAGQSFADQADKTLPLRYNPSNGCSVDISGAFVGAFKLSEAYGVIEKIQWRWAGYNPAWAGGLNLGVLIDGNYAKARGNIFVYSADANDLLISSIDPEFVRNLVINMCASMSVAKPMLNLWYAAGPKVIANTFLRPSDLGPTNVRGIDRQNASSALVRNNAVFGTAANSAFIVSGGTWDAGSGYNATDNSTAAGSNNQTSLVAADQLEDITSTGGLDLRAKSTGALAGNGTRDQTYTFDKDILDQNSSTTAPYVGAHESAAAGPAQLAGAPAAVVTPTGALNSTQVELDGDAAVVVTPTGNVTVINNRRIVTHPVKTDGITLKNNRPYEARVYHDTTGVLLDVFTGTTHVSTGVIELVSPDLVLDDYVWVHTLIDGGSGIRRYQVEDMA